VFGDRGQRGVRGRFGGQARNGAVGYGDATRMDANGAATRVDRVPPGMRPGGPGRHGPGGPGGPRRPGYGPRGPVKGSWWRTWTWKKALAVAGGTFGGLVLILVAVGFYMYNSTQIPSTALASAMSQNSTVYFSDGKTVAGTFGTTHRQLLTYNQIPKIMDDAAMAAEDRSFMTEGAISPTGMLRAAYNDITSSGGSLAGGSTITQQFVRNYYDDIGTQQTASRKLKEIFVAMKVGKAESKQWILMNYLNTIYLGNDAYGVAAAAQTYFGEPVSKLTVAQAAVLAALIQSPSYYPTPAGHAGLEYHWRNDVLVGLVKMGDITQAQADAMKFPTMRPSGSQFSGKDPWDAYIMQEVQGELEQYDGITQSQLDTGGYKITLTVSQQAEQNLYKAVNYNIGQIKASGGTLPNYVMTGAEEQNPANGEILAIYPGPGMNLPASQCHATCDLNATLQPGQVGSSFKPYVLSAAVKEGMNVQTSILNANGKAWVPPFSLGTTPSSLKPMPAAQGYFPVHNDTNTTIPGAMSNGGSTVQNALAQSSNVAFTDLAHRVGLQQVEQMAEAEGGVDPAAFKTEQGVGIALGIDSLTVNDQASMVSTIDNGGVYHEAHMVGSITESGGTVLHPKVKTQVVLTQAQDSQVQYAMQKTTVDGTGTAAAMSDGRPIIGKTGTTSSFKAGFFVGGIPQYSLAVGMFVVKPTDPNQSLLPMGGGGFGGTWPAAIWHSFSESMWASLPIQNFQNPVFTGQAWLQLPKPPKPKPKPTPSKTPHKGHHGLFPFPSMGPTSSPNPTPTSTCNGIFGCSSPTASPSQSTSPPPGGGGHGGGGGG
jgi:membrane peptidoglycan carboxypeptidase